MNTGYFYLYQFPTKQPHTNHAPPIAGFLLSGHPRQCGSPEPHQNFVRSAPELCSGLQQAGCDLEKVERWGNNPTHPQLVSTMPQKSRTNQTTRDTVALNFLSCLALVSLYLALPASMSTLLLLMYLLNAFRNQKHGQS